MVKSAEEVAQDTADEGRSESSATYQNLSRNLPKPSRLHPPPRIRQTSQDRSKAPG